MSEQALDLGKSVRILRRYQILVGIVVLLGILGGVSYAVANPPKLTSTSLIVLPASASPNMATEVVVAGSDPVLSSALPSISPPITLLKLRQQAAVTGLSPSVISVVVTSKSGPQAQSAANAIANSYVTYVNSASAPIGVGRTPARVLETATTPTGASATGAMLTDGLIGALAGLLVGMIASLAIGRKDSRLRERDAIANSIGVPVLASLPVSHPRGAAGWGRMLAGYQPASVYAWRLRKALHELGALGHAGNTGGRGEGASVLVLSLSGDPGALALGPQLAAYAASLGVRTALVVGPQQDANVSAALRTACASAAAVPRTGLRLAATGGDGELPNADLVVAVAVVDGRVPQVPETIRATSTVLGVSAGATTAEQLARVAVNAADKGLEITGILVADPDRTDSTTGQVPQLTRPIRRTMPTRLSGRITEIRR